METISVGDKDNEDTAYERVWIALMSFTATPSYLHPPLSFAGEEPQ